MSQIVNMIFGSRAYGTNTPLSDKNFKVVFIPNGKDILLQQVNNAYSEKRSKQEFEKNVPDEEETGYFSLQKYFKLLGEGQMVAIDMLFIPKNFWISYTPIWEEIVANRDKFLTRKSAAFIGYCRQQAKKYGIKGSRVSAVRETLDFLNNFPLSSQKLSVSGEIIEEFAKNKDFIDVIEIEQKNGALIKHLEVCGRKLPWTITVKNAIDIIQHLMDEYGQRALLAEKNEGLDWKALSHAVRIGQEAIELFTTHNITFPRPNAQELLTIKKGWVSYNEVAEKIETLFEEVEDAAAKSTLPEEVDHKWIEDFILKHYEKVIVDEYFLNPTTPLFNSSKNLL